MFSVSVVKPQWSGWREPFCWTGPKVALYESFDASSGLVLMEGAQQVESVPLVSGKVSVCLNISALLTWLSRHMSL